MVMKSKLQFFFFCLFFTSYNTPFPLWQTTKLLFSAKKDGIQQDWNILGVRNFFFALQGNKISISMLVYFPSFCTNNWDFYFWLILSKKNKFLWEIKFSENFIEIPKLIVFCFFIFFFTNILWFVLNLFLLSWSSFQWWRSRKKFWWRESTFWCQ